MNTAEMRSDPIVSLAVSMYANPGVYALLLGSGISRGAQIPTGWEVTLDLVTKLAAIQKQNVGADPTAWYGSKYREEPDYSKLLEKLAKTQAERLGLLRSYFEPTEEEREQGLKVPTAAHRAIAQLVKLGYVRMIVTTNFDRLLELALGEVGITPDVVHSASALDGAIPPIHSRCFVFKVHGDYRDTRFRNTVAELSTYPRKLRGLLDRIFDEYGLVIGGWSGEWDHALREAILRSPNRRFSTYWLTRGELGDAAKQVVDHRRATVVPIADADAFFTELLEKVEALHSLERPDPTSIAMAVATAKRYIAEPRHRIRLHDLLGKEAEALVAGGLSKEFDLHENVSKESFQQRLERYRALAERLGAVVAALAYHGSKDQAPLLRQAIERTAPTRHHDGMVIWLYLQRFPALLLEYVAGVTALASGNAEMLAATVLHPRCLYEGKRVPMLELVNTASIFAEGNVGRWLPVENAERKYTPANDYMYGVVRPLVADYLPDDSVFEETFDTFEYLVAAVYMDLVGRDWAPPGRFIWRHRYRHEEAGPKQFFKEGLAKGAGWELLQAGFFGGSLERCQQMLAKLDEFVGRVGRTWL